VASQGIAHAAREHIGVDHDIVLLKDVALLITKVIALALLLGLEFDLIGGPQTARGQA